MAYSTSFYNFETLVDPWNECMLSMFLTDDCTYLYKTSVDSTTHMCIGVYFILYISS